MIPLDNPLMIVAPQTRHAVSDSALESDTARAGFDDVWAQFTETQDQDAQSSLLENSLQLPDGIDQDDVAKDTGTAGLAADTVAGQHSADTPVVDELAPVPVPMTPSEVRTLTASRGDTIAAPPTLPNSQMSLVKFVSRPTQTASGQSEGEAHSATDFRQPAASMQIQLDTAKQTITSQVSKNGPGKTSAETPLPPNAASSPMVSGWDATPQHDMGTLSSVMARPPTQADTLGGRLSPNPADIMRLSVRKADSPPLDTVIAHASSKALRMTEHSIPEFDALSARQSLEGRDEPLGAQPASPRVSAQIATITPKLPISGLVAQVRPIEKLQADIAADSDHVPTVPTTTPQSNNITVTHAWQQFHHPTVVQQITTAIIQASGRTTEIALNPEELGRVRISLTPADTGMTVTIFSERPETADLMRRNIEFLAQEFMDLGYENLSFNFESPSEGSSGDGQQDDSNRADFEVGTLPTDVTPHLSISVALSSGLDLKL